MYKWRKMTPEEREEVLASRKAHRHPWHAPPHAHSDAVARYLVSAACYEHAPIIGQSPERLDAFEAHLLGACAGIATIHAWCVLPNHYHLLVETNALDLLARELAQVHGRSSHQWNGEDAARGRKVWFNHSDRRMRGEAHFWTSVNYVNHNAVKHGYAKGWQEWPWSSARQYLDEMGRDEAEQIWRAYPIADYGKGWDW